MKKSKWLPFSYDILLQAYEREAMTFGAIAESGLLGTLLPAFENFQTFLDKRWLTFNVKNFIREVSGDTGVLHVYNPSRQLTEIFAWSQVAGCCPMFSGWRIPVETVNKDAMRIYARQAVAPFQSAGVLSESLDEDEPEIKREMRTMLERIQNSDALRVITLLKLLGLYQKPSERCRQLSLAAGNASRDRIGLHIVPVIETRFSVPSRSRETIMNFRILANQVADIVLIDNDPAFREAYQSLNENKTHRVLAVNDDMDMALKGLSSLLESRGMGSRDLIAGLRIDHRMFTDIEKFFQLLVPLISDTADLVFTIGAGNNIDEFSGRLRVFDDLFDVLKNYGLEPVRLIMHAQGSLEQQRLQPAFGLSSYASHEILYCKLEKKKLAAAG